MPTTAQLSESLQTLTDDVNKLVEDAKRNDVSDELKKLIVAVNTLSSKVDTFDKQQREGQQGIKDDIQAMKDTVIQNLIESNKKTSDRLSIVEKRVTSLEKQLNINAQRSRGNNLELHGIDDSVSDNELPDTVLKILPKIKIECYKWDIQGCHRLPVRKGSTCKPTIVKFVNRRKAEDILMAKKDLNSCDFSELGISNSIFVNINLCPAFKELDYFSRKLKQEGKITSYQSSNTVIKIKKDNVYHKIYHIEDLRDIFPDDTFETKLYVKQGKY